RRGSGCHLSAASAGPLSCDSEKTRVRFHRDSGRGVRHDGSECPGGRPAGLHHARGKSHHEGTTRGRRLSSPYLPRGRALHEARGAGHEVFVQALRALHMDGGYLTTGAERGSSTGKSTLPLFEVEPATSQTTSNRQPS